MKVLVCGGRNFADKELVFKTLDKVLDKFGGSFILVHGGCKTGADKFADDWAKSREIPHWCFPAEWKKFGKKAGPIRNKRMRDTAKPDQCIAFEGGDGTKGMIDLMREVGIEPWLVGWRSEVRGERP